MKNKNIDSLYTTTASLIENTQKLIGNLELYPTEIVFKPIDFKNSHLTLCIPLSTIEKIEEFLVFDLARNGLWIKDKQGKFDMFVLDDLTKFKRILLVQLANLNTNDNR